MRMCYHMLKWPWMWAACCFSRHQAADGPAPPLAAVMTTRTVPPGILSTPCQVVVHEWSRVRTGAHSVLVEWYHVDTSLLHRPINQVSNARPFLWWCLITCSKTKHSSTYQLSNVAYHLPSLAASELRPHRAQLCMRLSEHKHYEAEYLLPFTAKQSFG